MSGIKLQGLTCELKNNDGSRVVRFGRTDMHNRVGIEVDGQVLFTISDEVKDRLAGLLGAL